MTKLHYFDQEKADDTDIMLKMVINQGYAPNTCLLGGIVVMNEVNKRNDPCAGCEGPREKCHGRNKR